MKPTKYLRSLILAAASTLLAVSSAYAGQIWDGGSGADSFWNTPENWDSDTLPTFGSPITFAGTTRATNVNDLAADTTIGGINFTNTTAGQLFSISGARITLGGNITTSASSGAGITDTVSLAMILNGNREITTGALHNLTLSGIISETGGARTLTKSGTGTLTLSGDNSYTGVTTISAGNLVISHNNALGTTAGNTTITAAGTGPRLLLSGGINSAENISISGSTESGVYDNVVSSISGTNTLSGNITLASPGAAGIRFGTNGGNLTLAGTINQTGTARTLILNASVGDITVNNAIANGTAALNIISQAASGSVTLKAAQGAGGIGAATIGESGVLKLGITNALRIDQNLTIGFNFSNTADRGTFDLAGFNQTVNALVGTPATSSPSANSTRIITNSAASGTSTLTVGNGNGSGTFNGVINDGATAAVALTKTGTGTLTLVGDSNYSGVTAINAGTITISHANALGSTTGNTTIAYNGSNTGGRLLLSGGITTAENITITGKEGPPGSYDASLGSSSGTNTFSGTITLTGVTGGGTIRLGAGTTIFSGNITQTGLATGLTLVGTTTVNNAIAINGNALTILGGGSVTSTLKGVSGSGIGNTVIAQDGILILGVSDALNTTGNLNVAGFGGTDQGTFSLTGFNQTVNALNSSASGANRIVRNNSATTASILTVGNGGGTGAFNGTIVNGASATLALIKTGAGNQTLSGVNTYTGGTRIDDGILILGHATDTLANGGAVNVNGGTLALGANTDTVGAVTLTSGSITGSGAGTLTGTGSAYDVRGGSVSAILAGSVGLTKTTAGTVTLTGANTYTGATSVNDGTLVVNGSLAALSAVSVGASGTLGGTGSIGGSLTFAATSIFDIEDINDPLAVSGTVLFGSGFGIANLAGIDWDSLALNTPYTLISTSQAFTSSDIANFGSANAAPVGTGRSAYFQSGSLQLVVVPEPTTMTILGAGVALLGLNIARRRKA